jgi:urease subunit alpha
LRRVILISNPVFSLRRFPRAKVGLGKRAVAVRGCRALRKYDMKLNDALPRIQVDAESYIVTADGEELRSAPADVLPLAQRYFLF